MKKFIDPFDYAGHILKAVKKGVLLTTKAGGKVNTMSISWGTLGIQWGLPIFTVFVRGCRHTSPMLEENAEFTINIPLEAADKEIIRFCGTQSGRDVNKFQALGLETEEPEIITVPGIRQLPLTLECKVIYKQKQDLSVLPQEIIDRFYPQVDETGFRDYHIAYYGEILGASLLEK